jgi:hypothetical protein
VFRVFRGEKSLRWSTTNSLSGEPRNTPNTRKEGQGAPAFFFRVFRVFRGEKSLRWSTTNSLGGEPRNTPNTRKEDQGGATFFFCVFRVFRGSNPPGQLRNSAIYPN